MYHSVFAFPINHVLLNMSLLGFVVLDVSLQFFPHATIWLRNFQFSDLSVENLLCTTLIVLFFYIILESVCIFSIGN